MPTRLITDLNDSLRKNFSTPVLKSSKVNTALGLTLENISGVDSPTQRPHAKIKVGLF